MQGDISAFPFVPVPTEFDVHRLDVRPGDSLIVTCPKMLPSETVRRIREVLGTWAGNRKVLVLDGGLKITVVGAEVSCG
jgi:hypothetical protein